MPRSNKLINLYTTEIDKNFHPPKSKFFSRWKSNKLNTLPRGLLPTIWENIGPKGVKGKGCHYLLALNWDCAARRAKKGRQLVLRTRNNFMMGKQGAPLFKTNFNIQLSSFVRTLQSPPVNPLFIACSHHLTGVP